MKNRTVFTLGMCVMPVAMLGIGVALASSVATPNTFIAGTPAVAAQVNDNFTAHAAAINDNDTRITNKVVVESNADAGFTGIPNANSALFEMNSVMITAPSAGKVHVTWHGHTVFFEDGKSVAYAVSDQNAAMPAGAASNGRLDGAGTDRFQRVYFHQAVFPVTAGTHTFYGLAQGSATFDDGVANVLHGTIVAMFVADN